QGAAVQDRQMARGDRYPGLGLHWLLGLVRLRQGDHAEAVAGFDREMKLANPHRLYCRENQMRPQPAPGLCFLGMGKNATAIAALEEAVDLYPDHAPSLIALAQALNASGARDRATATRHHVATILETLPQTRPVEASIVESQSLVADGRLDAAASGLDALLET